VDGRGTLACAKLYGEDRRCPEKGGWQSILASDLVRLHGGQRADISVWTYEMRLNVYFRTLEGLVPDPTCMHLFPEPFMAFLEPRRVTFVSCTWSVALTGRRQSPVSRGIIHQASPVQSWSSVSRWGVIPHIVLNDTLAEGMTVEVSEEKDSVPMEDQIAQ
jgi:hypothetical protein